MHAAFRVATLGQVVFLAAGHAGNIEPFRITDAAFTVDIDHIVRSPLIVLSKHPGIKDILSDKDLVGNLYDLHLAGFCKGDDVVQIGAVGDKLIFFQAGSDKSLLAVDIELHIGNGDLLGLNGLEKSDFRFSLPALPIFREKIFVIGHRKVHEVIQIVPHLFHICLQRLDLGVELLDIELVDPADRFLGQFNDILADDGALQLFPVGFECFGNRLQHFFPVGVSLFEFLIDLLLKKYLFQRGEVPLVLEFSQLDLKLPLKKVLGTVDGGLKQFLRAKELRLLVDDDTGVRRNADFAIRKCIEGIDRDIRRDTRRQVDLDLDFRGRIVGYLFDLYFALVIGLEDRIDKLRGGDAIGHVPDEKGLLVELLDMGPDAYLPAATPVVIVRDIDHSGGQKVGEELEFLPLQVFHGRFAKLTEVMRQDLGCEADSNAFGPLGQQQRKFHRQRDRFVFPAVITKLPLGGLRIEGDFQREFAEARFD